MPENENKLPTLMKSKSIAVPGAGREISSSGDGRWHRFVLKNGKIEGPLWALGTRRKMVVPMGSEASSSGKQRLIALMIKA